jgi:hypothetical protein
MSRVLRSALLLLLSACSPSPCPGWGAAVADAADIEIGDDGGADASASSGDAAWREVGEDPLSCSSSPACAEAGRCSSVQGFCHAWHAEDCAASRRCIEEGIGCCWYGLPTCSTCAR